MAIQIPESEMGAYLRLSMREKDGREVAFEQIKLSEGSGQELTAACATITEDGEYAIISGKDFTYKFNLHYGCLEE